MPKFLSINGLRSDNLQQSSLINSFIQDAELYFVHPLTLSDPVELKVKQTNLFLIQTSCWLDTHLFFLKFIKLFFKIDYSKNRLLQGNIQLIDSLSGNNKYNM